MPLDILHTDTIVALATPPGVGAIGLIRLSGKDAVAIADKAFWGKKLTGQPTHTIHFGMIRDEQGKDLDEVLASLFIAPKSYTGEDVVEVSCHGSPYILQEVIQLFIRLGARLAKPGEFTLRAFLNGKMDLSQAEAVADLIASESSAAHSVAMQQMRGGFSQEIQRLRQELIQFASLIELELDFSEEDVEFANRDELRRLVEKIRTVIRALIRSFQLGNVIKNGVSTVIAGRPNAGKSTLLNALLNEERAIVSEIAGTTRDTIEEVLNINGIPFRIIDTAGIREARDTIEAIGVERTLEKVRQGSLLVYVFDVILTQPADVHADLERLARPGVPLLIVANKMDLNPHTRFEHYFPVGSPAVGSLQSGSGQSEGSKGQAPADTPSRPLTSSNPLTSSHPLTSSPPLPLSKESWVPISAKAQMNIEYLKEKLYEAAVGEDLLGESTVVSNVRHLEALQHTDESLTAVLAGMDNAVTSDFIAMDIRRALHYLGEITGEITTEDLLDHIFSKFCIGK